MRNIITLITLFFLSTSKVFAIVEFDELAVRIADHLCQSEPVVAADFVSWLSTGTPEHQATIVADYNLENLSQEKKEQLFQTLVRIIEIGLPNNSKYKNCMKQLLESSEIDDKYYCAAALFNYMPKPIVVAH